MPNSRLDPYRDEIMQMVRARRTQAEIIQHLANEYGITIRKSSLSEFIKKNANTVPSLPANEPRVSPEEENFLAQAEVYTELQASALALRQQIDTLTAALKETGNAVYTLATDTEQRDSALQNAMQKVHDAVMSFSQRGNAAPAKAAPATSAAVPSSAIPPALVRKIWKRAFVITGVLWLIFFLWVGYYFQLWRFKATPTAVKAAREVPFTDTPRRALLLYRSLS